MCGIVGIFEKHSKINKDTLIRMRDTLSNRGPDDKGIFISSSGKTGLGFRRLSIIDLSETANQPLSNEDGTKWILFNGEIYNYKSIRDDLISKGYKFKSMGDTETILHAYEEWGINAVDKFNGMFAYSIYDCKMDSFHIFRDRFGIKPLYYFDSNSTFIFASELKAIIQHPQVSREINEDALDDYFTYGYVPYDKSIFKNIKKLPAGHYLKFEENNIEVKKYWNLEYNPVARNENELVEGLSERLFNAVNLWCVSDVPVGAFLSGGLDSTSVVSYMQNKSIGKIKTFSIGFDDDKRNETHFAKIAAQSFQTEHYENMVTVDDAKKVIPMLAQIYDEPFMDTSSVPTYLVSRFASEKVKVVLTGDGGDEIFFGYGWYKEFMDINEKRKSQVVESVASRIINIFRHLPYLARIASLEKNYTNDEMRRYFWLMSYFDRWEKKKIFNINFDSNKDPLWLFRKFFIKEMPLNVSLRMLDINTYLVDDILTKVDRASMANSLEARTPLLDHTLAEFAMTIPSEDIYRNNERKYIFKKAVSNDIPLEILNRGKRGFSSPIVSWLQGSLNKTAIDKVVNGYAVKDGLINPLAVKNMIKNLTKRRWYKLWMLMVFEEWYRQWIYNISDINSDASL